MKGNSEHFDGYNRAGSKDVGVVTGTFDLNVPDGEQPKVPTEGTPNSVTIVRKNGKIIQERYYDGNGQAALDIDYTDHGNPKTHPVVPHQHRWHSDDKGKLHRGNWEEIHK
jgi:hypothetical protein